MAIVSNLRSERNRSVNGAAVRTVLARRRLCAYAELNDFGELPGIVDRFRTAGIDHIVVDGGDGTIQALLTELMANRCDRRFRPRLAILPSGMTNLIAADVGVKGCGAAALERVLDALENCRETVLSRPTLRLDLVDSVDGMVRRSLSGMFFGAAALHHGAEFARDRVHAHGIKHAAGVAFTIAGIAWRSLLPRRPDFFLGDEIAVSVDEGPVDLRPRFLFIATTLERLVLGLWPFWDLGSGGLRYFDVPAPPPRLLTSMARVLAQRPSPTMARAGYRSGRAERLSLALRAPCMLDGEVVQPGPDEAVALSVGPVVDFVRV